MGPAVIVAGAAATYTTGKPDPAWVRAPGGQATEHPGRLPVPDPDRGQHMTVDRIHGLNYQTRCELRDSAAITGTEHRLG